MTGGVLLVLRALGLGDLLTAVPAFRALADAFPHHRRLLATAPELSPLALLTGAVHAVIPARPLGPLREAPSGVDCAVNLHGRGPQSHRVLLALAPRRLVAFAHPDVSESAVGPRWRFDEHEVSRWCRLLTESGIPADPTRLDIPEPAGPVPADVIGATLIHPGAAGGARRWPIERWATVARAERRAGRTVIVTGGPGEIPLARELARAAGLPTAWVYAGATDVLELARLVAAAGRVVCGDTGVAHLATALRTPSVLLFGPTSPAHWGPPPARSWHRVLWSRECGDPHGEAPDPGLLRIGVADVVGALADLPSARAVEAAA